MSAPAAASLLRRWSTGASHTKRQNKREQPLFLRGGRLLFCAFWQESSKKFVKGVEKSGPA